MKLKTLKIKHFLGVSEATVNFDSLPPLLLIKGPNGVGKSTIFNDAIVWALFGKLPRGQCPVITRGERLTSVTLCIQKDDDELQICRHQKEKNSSVALTVNGEQIEARIKDVNKTICDYVSPSLFIGTNLLNQGFSTRFTALSNNEKTSLIESLINTDSFAAAEQEAKIRKVANQSEINNIIGKLDRIKHSNIMLNRQLQDDKKLHEKAQADLKAEKDKDKAKHTELDAELKQVEADLDKQISATTQLQAKLKLLEGEIQAVLGRIQQGTSTIAITEQQLKGLREQHNSLANVHKCPTCLRDLTGEDAQGLLQNIVAIGIKKKEELNKFQQHLTTLQRKYTGENSKRNQLQHDINTAQTTCAQLGQRKINIKMAEAELQKDETTGIQNAIASIEQRMEKTKAEMNQNQNISVKLEELLEEKQQLQQRLEFWCKGFGPTGIRNLLLDGLLKTLNERINWYAMNLVDKHLKVMLSPETELQTGTTRNKLSLRVHTDKGEATYKGLSGGQKRKVDLTIHLALRDVAKELTSYTSNLLVADEVFDSLDKESSEALVGVLRELKDVKVVVVSHDDSLTSHFENVVTIEANKSFTL